MRYLTPRDRRNAVDAASWHKRLLAEKSIAGADANRVVDRLWQGSLPSWPQQLQGFDRLVLCARELQPPSQFVPVAVDRILLDDDQPSDYDVQLAYELAERLARAKQRRGERILITCAAGLNRSGLIMGLTMRRIGYTGEQAVALIRKARGPRALSNAWFEALVLRP